jgi:hypothetical protein
VFQNSLRIAFFCLFCAVCKPHYWRHVKHRAEDWLKLDISPCPVGRGFPFAITGIQVDGASECMAEFQQACKDKALALFVLPPKRPQLNGAVERAQASWRYEFYACHDLPHHLNQHIDAFAHLYNYYRRHAVLGEQTPTEYLNQTSKTILPSQMY